MRKVHSIDTWLRYRTLPSPRPNDPKSLGLYTEAYGHYHKASIFCIQKPMATREYTQCSLSIKIESVFWVRYQMKVGIVFC